MPDYARRKPAKLSRLSKTALLLVIVLVALEAGMRIVFAIPPLRPLLTVNDSYSWQRQWIARHQDAGHDVFYSYDIFHPTLGWATAPNLRDVPVFEGKFLNTNSEGFRGTAEFPVARLPGVPRILLLGDSFTFGDEVSDDETFAYFLSRLIPGAEIINLGVHGYGHDQMLLLFLEEGLRYRPDIVVLGYIHADLDRNLLWFRDFAKPVFEATGDGLVLRHSPVPAPETVLGWDWLRPRLLDASSIIRTGADVRSGVRAQAEQEITHRVFDQLVEAIRFSGAVPVFAYLPFGQEILAGEPPVPGEIFLFDYCSTNPDVLCFSARPEFATRALAGVEFRTEFHWAAPGHQAVAQAIYDFLLEAGLINAQ